jgi:preprotein translocase subunit SecA
MKLFKKLFKSSNDRAIARIQPLVQAVNQYSPSIAKLTDDELKGKTNIFRQKLDNGASLEDLKIEAFAVAREAAWRVLGMRPYDVQVLGGYVLHQGDIAEMKTGEGKTLVATMPTYLNALTSKGVHVVTVNDYLARRDAEWMGQLYRWLGLSTGVIVNGLNDSQRQAAYNSDITYGQNNEFGFDYLRDNMKFKLSDYVQRELNFAIIDEVDSILIDEARTPLIISGPAENANELYQSVDAAIPKLKKDLDYNVDEKHHSATLTDEGIDKIELLLGIDHLYDPANIVLLHHINNALKAHTLYRRDVNYLVQNSQVMIIDEHTGRLMEGRRWSDGLHQAVEAKEGVAIQAENHTLANISFQNYFRIYNKLSGMTGTAKTEEEEFQKIYSLNVFVIPTNREIQRKDNDDLLYRTEKGKFKACVDQIKFCHAKGQPVLVGTTSVEKSEIIHKLLKREKISHEVLNAKHHMKEASIVAQAGRFGRITVATNMAGRGTDIILGGNAEYWGQARLEGLGVAVRYTDAWEYVEDFVKKICINKTNEAKAMRSQYDVLSNIEDSVIAEIEAVRDEFKSEQKQVLEAGGLFILGTERHESRRIDNQLRGRAGRQGDPGESCFFLSFEDDLMRVFSSNDVAAKLLDKSGLDDSQPIAHPMASRSVENAQRQLESQHFDHRKNLLEYDDVMNQQRKSIYKFRLDVLRAENQELQEIILDSIEDVLRQMIQQHCNSNLSAERWDVNAFIEALQKQFDTNVELDDLPRNHEFYLRRIYFKIEETFKQKRDHLEQIQEGALFEITQQLYLETIDEFWKRHLQTMDQLRSGIGLRSYGQRDPKKEYQREGFNLFLDLMHQVRSQVMGNLFFLTVKSKKEIEEERAAYENYIAEQGRKQRLMEERQKRAEELAAARSALQFDDEQEVEKSQPVRRERPKVSRNAPCWCGSGKKYKKCHFNEDQRLDA